MFFHSLLSSLLYYSFYLLPFLRSVHIFIFLSLFIFSRVILLPICKVLFTFFKLENDLERSYNFFASFYLKILL